MIYRRRVGVLGIFVLSMFSLIAYSAVGAQAQEWLIEGKTLKERGIAAENIAGLTEGTNRLHVLKLNALLKCEIEISGAEIRSLGHGLATLRFHECYVTDLNLKEAACTVTPFIMNVLLQVFLHAGGTYIRVSPAGGGAFATVKAAGVFCILPKEAALTGSFVAQVIKQGEIAILTSTKSTLELFPADVLTYGVHTAHFESDFQLVLAGANLGKPWGAH